VEGIRKKSETGRKVWFNPDLKKKKKEKLRKGKGPAKL